MSVWRRSVRPALFSSLVLCAAASGARAQGYRTRDLPPSKADPLAAATPGQPAGDTQGWPDPQHDAATELPSAHSDDSNTIGDRPWAEGISAIEQDKARQLFQQGNQLLNDGLFSQAIRSYRAALEHWDHPGIHYNYALASFTLDQPLETRAQLIAASAFGPAPLGEERYQNVQRYRILVERQLASVDVRCDAPGAVVTLDGKSLFVAPGHYQGVVLPGVHTLLATKPHYLDDERRLTLLPGKPGVATLELYTASELTRTRRLWPSWTPTLVTAAGAAVTLAGGVLTVAAAKQLDDYDGAVQQRCGSTGCPVNAPGVPQLERRRDRAETLDVTGKVILAVGGVTLVTGLVLMYLNRAEEYRITPLRREPHSGPMLSIAPIFSLSTRGVVARGTF